MSSSTQMLAGGVLLALTAAALREFRGFHPHPANRVLRELSSSALRNAQQSAVHGRGTRNGLTHTRVSNTFQDFGKGGSNIARKMIRFSIRWKFPTLNVCLKLSEGGADL